MASQFVNFKTAQSNPENKNVSDIDPKELWERMQDVTIIDVRRPDEYEGELGHIPGAQLMVLDTLPTRVKDIPCDKTVVFVCRSGGRSGRATAFAKEQGYQNVFNMKGGMLLWNEMKLEVEGRSR